jgi:2,3-bisphosphoglycerate-independent phosphoglycerate mutase
MSHVRLPDDLAVHGVGGGTIIMLVMDGLGGLPHPDTGRTELESAETPHLDKLAARSSLGMLSPVGHGVTPGSGPGHLALFGFDPIESMIGRGVLSALGVGFELEPGDVAARLNMATVDEDGVVTDRRAGRPSDEDGRRVIEVVRDGLRFPEGVAVTLIHEKEHRAVLVLRGEGLGAGITDTDPQRTGLRPLAAEATGIDPASERTAAIVQGVLDQVGEILADEPRANSFLARGFGEFTPYPTFDVRYNLRAVAVARYPMYRGVAALVGMTIDGVPDSNENTVEILERHFGSYDFYFIHFKDTDSRAHDGDFDGKVAAIEEVDALLPRITELGADVLIVTGDHSTPALYGEHTWHHVPTLVASSWSRPSAEVFGEASCRGGDLGIVPGKELMSLALAHAARLDKYGA